MSRRLQDNIVALVILGIFVAAFLASFGYGPRARLVPVPLSVLGIVLILTQLVVQNASRRRDLHVGLFDGLVGEAPAAAGGPAAPADDGSARTRRELLGLLIVVGLLGLFVVLGPIPAIFVFVFAYTVAARQLGLLGGLLTATIFTATAYAVFGWGLGVRLDRGLIGFGIF
jgi:hypothetical protein